MRENILIDSSCYTDVQDLTDDEQGKLYKALIDFGFDRKEPDNLSGSLLVIYKVLARRMAGAQAKYDAAARNGKLGGRPKKTSTKTSDKTSNKTSTKTSDINQWENQTETERKTKTKFSFPNDNKNKNIFYLTDCAGVRAKEYDSSARQEFLTPYYDYHKGTIWGDAVLEIIDTLLEFREYAHECGEVKYNSKTYSASQIDEILKKHGKYVVDALPKKLVLDETIRNKPMYIIGVLLDKTK